MCVCVYTFIYEEKKRGGRVETHHSTSYIYYYYCYILHIIYMGIYGW
jgi:hypothetical protein